MAASGGVARITPMPCICLASADTTPFWPPQAVVTASGRRASRGCRQTRRTCGKIFIAPAKSGFAKRGGAPPVRTLPRSIKHRRLPGATLAKMSSADACDVAQAGTTNRGEHPKALALRLVGVDTSFRTAIEPDGELYQSRASIATGSRPNLYVVKPSAI